MNIAPQYFGSLLNKPRLQLSLRHVRVERLHIADNNPGVLWVLITRQCKVSILTPRTPPDYSHGFNLFLECSQGHFALKRHLGASNEGLALLGNHYHVREDSCPAWIQLVGFINDRPYKGIRSGPIFLCAREGRT